MFSKLFEENKKAPFETLVYLSRPYYYWQLVLAIFWISVGIFMFLVDFKIIGILFICYTIYSLRSIFKFFNIIKENKVQMSLSEKGISLQGKRVISWNSISNEKIIVKPNYSAPAISWEYLTFDVKSRQEKVLINNLDINSLRLEYLLKIYRRRSLVEK